MCDECLNYIPNCQCPTDQINPLFEEEIISVDTLSKLHKQSEDLQDGKIAEVTHENLHFIDAGLASSTSTNMVSYKPDSDTGGHLGDFLQRPVAINSFSWVEGSTTKVQNTFLPWKLYFNTASIKNKLQNYARIRCKLRLKFVVNASPFYYGAIRVCYCPIAGSTSMDTYYSSGDQIKFSQMPGDFLYPADMTSFEMELPFLWMGSWLDLGKSGNLDNMGNITYMLYSVLQSANGVPATNATITCYAWAEDVELAGLTSGLILQSDEYEDMGPISGPASAVAGLASRLTDVPVIGPMARATEIGARAVGGIASLFGYSNPPNISDAAPYFPKSFHGFSNVETSIPSDKLSVDPKNEITIDKTVTGAPSEDQLTVESLVSRKSFVSGSLWTEAYAPGTQLFVMAVTPRIFSSNAGTSQNFINQTPTCLTAAMFRQWRGTMIYTVKFVKSRYHTGRVQISWDPQGAPGANSETTTMTRIVDLQTETEVDFAIPFKAKTPWLSTASGANIWSNSTSGTITNNALIYNGQFKITVLNELTGPAVSQSLDILIFARGGKDMRFAVPTDLPDFSSLSVQSELLVDIASKDVEDMTPAVTVGENVLSLRQLLHRANYWHTQYLGNPLSAASTYNLTGLYFHVNYIPRFPLEPGYTSLGLNYATGLVVASRFQYQFSPNIPINWLGNCFAGYRGSLVHHFNPLNNGAPALDALKAERDYVSYLLDYPRAAINRFSNSNSTASASSLARLPTTTSLGVKRQGYGQRGMAITNTNTQSALSIVTPQYSNWKFRPSYIAVRDTDPTNNSELDSIKISSVSRCGSSSTSVDNGWPAVEIYVAAGVDFDLLYFICCPTYFEFATPTADNTF